MNKNQFLDNITLQENAYFFKNTNSIKLTKSKIEQIFRDSSTEKTGGFILNSTNKK